jgi:peptide/nickel transport system permease protein
MARAEKVSGASFEVVGIKNVLQYHVAQRADPPVNGRNSRALDWARTGHFVIVAAFILVAVFPWHLVLTSQVDLGSILASPTLAHPLGTDNIGRDLLLRLGGAFAGAVLPLWCAAMIGTLLGIALAIPYLVSESAGTGWRKWLARLQNGSFIVLSSLPIGISVFCAAVWGGTVTLLGVALISGAFFAARASLLTRDLYFQSRSLGYWCAHESLGGGSWERIWRYGICGDWLEELVFVMAFNLKVAIAVEAGLSYLGFGVPEPQPSLGNILASHFDLVLKGQFMVPLITVASLFVIGQFPDSLARLLMRNRANNKAQLAR